MALARGEAAHQACPVLVSFKRTGVRRYAVIVAAPDGLSRAADPAPGYDDDIPHDLVHYVVEAELRFTNGVFGRVARGAGTFVMAAAQDASPRERARQQRKQAKRERGLRAQGGATEAEMVESERIAALSDVAWRRQAGQRPDASRAAPVMQPEDRACVERVVTRLNVLAPLWRALPVGGELVFQWPSLEATQRPVTTLLAQR